MKSRRTSLLLGTLGALAITGMTGYAQTSSIPIQHFIFIVQENHSFDNCFGTYPGANGIPSGTLLPDFPGDTPKNAPFLQTNPSVHDMSHSWATSILDYDNGAMDGFMWGEWPTAASYYKSYYGITTPQPDPHLVKKIPSRYRRSQALLNRERYYHHEATLTMRTQPLPASGRRMRLSLRLCLAKGRPTWDNDLPGLSTRWGTMTQASFLTIGPTPTTSRCATIFFQPCVDPASQIIFTLWRRSQAVSSPTNKPTVSFSIVSLSYWAMPV